ncbi:MAG TPA: hypothetical protein VJ986_00670, partial [Gaiellaceae bacterium]|nr:hypothetical protein [Gaiellaceae bacterium]
MERRAELALSALVAASMHVAAIGGVSLLARPAATPTSSAGRVHDSRVVLLSSEQLNAILDPTPSAPRPREAAATTHDVELDPLTTATGSGAAPEWTPLPATDEPVRALSLRVVRAPRPAELLTPPAAGCESEVATSSDAAQ